MFFRKEKAPMRGMQKIKLFLYMLFTSGILFVVFAEYVFGVKTVVLETIFSISIAGLIGISTNTIAITMLFRPLEKTFFGRQGLLPKNKEKIAKALSETVKERLINEKSIAEFIFREDKIKKLSEKSLKAVEKFLQKKQNQKRIINFLHSIERSSIKDDLIVEIEKFLEKNIENLFVSQELSFTEMFNRMRRLIKEKRKKDPLAEETIEILKEIIKEFLVLNSDKIARKINEIIDSFLEGRLFGVAPILKKILISDEKLIDSIEDYISDREKIRASADFIEEMLPVLDEVIMKKEIRERLYRIYVRGLDRALNYLKNKGIPYTISLINRSISEIFEDNEKMEKLFIKFERVFKDFIEKTFQFIRSNVTEKELKAVLLKLKVGENVSRLVYNNILSQSIEEFEQLTKKIMGENLSYIEVMGGILGVLVGFSLQFKITLLIVPLLILAFLFLDSFLSKKFTSLH